MKKNRPIRDKVAKHAPDVRGQIHATAKERRTQMGEEVKFAQTQLNEGDARIENLKEQIVSTKRTNNTTRVGAIAAVAAGTLTSNLVFLQGGDSPTDVTLKYVIALSACFAAGLMNKHFNETDITMTEMLKRTNSWARQEFRPEEIQTFKELYDEVKDDFAKNPSLKDDVKSNFVYRTSQGVIVALAIACAASGFDKLGYGVVDVVFNRNEKDSLELPLDPNDPMLNSGQNLSYPKFD